MKNNSKSLINVLLMLVISVILVNIFMMNIFGNDLPEPEETTADETTELDDENEPVSADGSVKLTVIDSHTNEGIADTVFGIYSVSNIKLYELTTDTNGTAVISSIPQGEYYLKQIKVPDGYETDPEKYGIAVFPDVMSELIVTMTEISLPVVTDGAVSLTIKDFETNRGVKDVIFGLYNLNDVKLYELVTNNNGEAVISSIPQGEYYLKQIKIPNGYEFDDEKYGITVTPDNVSEIELAVVKTPIPIPEITDGSVKLTVKNKETNKKETNKGVKNIIFGVYNLNDIKLYELTTDNKGEAFILSILQGEYYLKQIKAPDGYEIDPEKYGVTVNAGYTSEIVLTALQIPVPKYGQIKLTVKDSETDKGVEDVVIGVYILSTGERICDIKTDYYGEAVCLKIPQGDYYTGYIEVPGDYEADAVRYGVRVLGGITSEISLTIVKSPVQTESDINTDASISTNIHGKLHLSVTDYETGRGVGNAVFGVYNPDGIKLYELTTNSNGKASISSVPQGGYYLKQIRAGIDYEIDQDKHGVTVEVDSVSEVTLTAVKIPVTEPEIPVIEIIPEPEITIESPDTEPSKKGEVLILNKAEYSGKSLSGALFGVYSGSGNKITELTTNTDGKAVAELESGEYYLRELKSAKGYITGDSVIPFTIVNGEIIIVEITSIIANSNDETIITLPKTGIDFPIMTYITAFTIFGLAVAISILVYNSKYKLKY